MPLLPDALALGPVAVLALIFPLALALNPVATLSLPAAPAALASLAFAFGPNAALLLLVVPLLALALVPQATLLMLPVAFAAGTPAPCGSLPSVLPPQTNCACAGGAL